MTTTTITPKDLQQPDMTLENRISSLKIVDEINTHHTALLKRLLVFQKDGRDYIIAASFDHTVSIWDLETKKLATTLQGHEDGIYNIAVLNDGRIASCGFDETIKIWDISDMSNSRCVQTLEGHTDCVNSLVELPNSILVSGSMAQTLRLWDLKDTSPILHSFKTIRNSKQSVVNHMALVTNNGLAVSSFSHINIYMVKPHKGYEFYLTHILTGHKTYVRNIRYISGQRKLISGGADCVLKIWDLNTGRCLRTLHGHGSWVFNIFILSNGIFASASSEIKIWKMFTGECIKSIEGEQGKNFYTLAKYGDCLIFTGDDPKLSFALY